jgi:hypothetical protein
MKARDHQRCRLCGNEMFDTLIAQTNQGWMHSVCVQAEIHRQATATAEKAVAQLDEVTTQQMFGTRDEMLAFIRQHPFMWVLVAHQPSEGRSRRWTWWVS